MKLGNVTGTCKKEYGPDKFFKEYIVLLNMLITE